MVRCFGEGVGSTRHSGGNQVDSSLSASSEFAQAPQDETLTLFVEEASKIWMDEACAPKHIKRFGSLHARMSQS